MNNITVSTPDRASYPESSSTAFYPLSDFSVFLQSEVDFELCCRCIARDKVRRARRCRAVCFGESVLARNTPLSCSIFRACKNARIAAALIFTFRHKSPDSGFYSISDTFPTYHKKADTGQTRQKHRRYFAFIDLPFITSKLHSVYDSPYSLTSRFKISNIDCSILRGDSFISSVIVS